MLKSHGFWRKHEAPCWECDPDLALALLRTGFQRKRSEGIIQTWRLDLASPTLSGTLFSDLFFSLVKRVLNREVRIN